MCDLRTEILDPPKTRNLQRPVSSATLNETESIQSSQLDGRTHDSQRVFPKAPAVLSV